MNLCRYMYWAECGLFPSIQRARLDGSGRDTFINSSIRAPYGLAIDYTTDSLYWCDQRLDKIVRVSLETSMSTVVVTNVTDCVGVAIVDQHLYWIDA